MRPRSPSQVQSLIRCDEIRAYDGNGITLDSNTRWTDALARRLVAADLRRGIANEGIALGRVVVRNNADNGGPGAADAPCVYCGPTAIDRLDRDVLSRPSVKYLILFEGINDVAAGVDASTLISAMQQIAGRAHAKGIKIYGATLTPFKGTPGYAAQTTATIRQAVNAWVRSGRAFDGVIDFDRVVRDATDTERIEPTLDSGDHLHLNENGYAAMANSIDLAIFRN